MATRMQGAPPAPTAPTRRHVLSTSTLEAEPTAIPAARAGHASSAVRSPRPQRMTTPSVYRPQRRYTTAAWALTVLPGIGVATMIAVQSVAPRAESLWAGTVILLLALHVLIASSDRAALVRDGHVKAASPMLALFGPVYFIVRAVIVSTQTRTNAVWPLLVSLTVAAAVVASLLYGDDAVTTLVGILP